MDVCLACQASCITLVNGFHWTQLWQHKLGKGWSLHIFQPGQMQRVLVWGDYTVGDILSFQDIEMMWPYSTFGLCYFNSRAVHSVLVCFFGPHTHSDLPCLFPSEHSGLQQDSEQCIRISPVNYTLIWISHFHLFPHLLYYSVVYLLMREVL